jgi:hypothetical protein
MLLAVCSPLSFSPSRFLPSFTRPVVLIAELRRSITVFRSASSSVLLRCFSMLLLPSNCDSELCLDSRRAMRSLHRLQCHSAVGTCG